MSKVAKPLNPLQEKVAEAAVSKGVRQYRTLVVQSYVVLATIGFGVLAALAHFFPYFPIDLKITQFLQSINFPGFSAVMDFVSLIGRAPIWPALIIFFIIFLLASGLKWESVCASSNAIGLALIDSTLKDIVQRSRPSLDLVHVLNKLTDYGFPSGHVFGYTAFFGFLAFLAYSLIQHSLTRTILILTFLSLIILVGPSRIYLGEHWPSDVLGAYLVGTIWLLLTIYFYRWGKPRYFNKQKVAPEKI